MKVLMLVSLTMMPEWRVCENGTVVDVSEETGTQWIKRGLAKPVSPLPERAVVDPQRESGETATAAPQRKRGKA